MPKIPNAQLQKLAQENNVSFNGGIETADNDNVHPKQYKKEHLQAVSTSAQTDVGQAVASGCGDYVGGGIDLNANPNDLKEIVELLLTTLAVHESSKATWNAYNDGTVCARNSKGKGSPKRYNIRHPQGDNYAVITQMTPADVFKRYYLYEKDWGKGDGQRFAKVACDPVGNRLFAVGAYQFIPSTLHSAVRKPQFRDYLHKPLTPENQKNTC